MPNSRLSLPRPNEVINQSPMALGQWIVVFACIFAMALDGYDVMSIALAAPEIAKEWDLSKAQLGLILPLEFLGMALGAIFVGTLSDYYGRKLVSIVCLVVVSIGMTISAYAPDMGVMGASRVFTGLGIGGMLAAATAICSEYSNNKNRALAVILVAGGYTLGIFLASKISGVLLSGQDWRAIFKLGALISVCFIPFVMVMVPESLSLLERRGTKKDEKAISRTLKRFGHSGEYRLATEFTQEEKVSPKQLFSGENSQVTTVMVLFYFGNILTYYFFIKWMPPAITELGYTSVQGADILATISLVGLAGSIAMAILSRLFPLKPVMIVALFGSAISVAAFPLFTDSVSSMHLIGGIAGFCLYAVISGAFGMFAQSFPSHVLASGTGLVLGTGRGGAVSGPWVGGLIFAGGMTLTTVAPIMALGSLTAALALFFLPPRD